MGEYAYKLRHPEKYIGDVNKVMVRSSWEAYAFEFMENNKNIIKWASEPFPIKYWKPLQNGEFRPANYWPDIYVEYKDKNGEYIKELMEIKPLEQTMPSKSKRKKTKQAQDYIYLVNMYKWEAAKKWCDLNGIKFKVYTQETLFGAKK